MVLADLGEQEFLHRLKRGALVIRSGPFKFRISSPIETIAEGLRVLYADYPLGNPEEFADFNLALETGSGLHRWWRPQVRFQFDGRYPFEPLPISHAYPQLEWAMNWCISSHIHSRLILHSAVIERNGHAVIMPAPPGSGKSTLCAALVNRGWRLLSDELALISLQDMSITPLVRPVSLKNESIEIIKSYVPSCVFNRVTHDTLKGTVTHMKVAPDHLRRMDEKAPPRWIIFPRYVRHSAAELTPYSKAQGMLELGRNAFNYSILGRNGFETLSKVMSMSDCYQFRYSEFDEALSIFDSLATNATAIS